MLRPHLQIQLITAAARRVGAAGGGRSQRGSIALFLLVALGVTVGAVAIANSSSNSLLRSAFQDQSRNAREAANAGADTIINELNLVENRRLLVTSRALSTWTNDKNNAQIDFFKNNRCAVAGTGLPTAAAVGFKNGTFQTLPGAPNRQFRLVSIQKIATKNRANSVTSFSVADGSGTSAITDYDEAALNITDGAATKGENVGYIRLTVQGKASQPGGGNSIATVTREFEVVPKCCGRSFGLPLDPSSPLPPASAARGVHGKDIRTCGASVGGPGELGLVFGINGGKLQDNGAPGRFITLNSAGKEVTIDNIVCAINEDGPRDHCAGVLRAKTEPGYEPENQVPTGYTFEDLNFPSEVAYFGNASNTWPWFPATTIPAITTTGVIDSDVTNLQVDETKQVVQEMRNGTWTTTGVTYCGVAPVQVNKDTKATQNQYHCKIDTIAVGNKNLVIDTGSSTLNLYITNNGKNAISFQGKQEIVHERNGVSLGDAGISNCSAPANAWVNNLRIFGTPIDKSGGVGTKQEIRVGGTALNSGMFVWAPYSTVEYRGTADFCGRIWANNFTTIGEPTFRVPPTSSKDDIGNPAQQNRFYDWVARSVSTVRLFQP